jgi:hypothetical protein
MLGSFELRLSIRLVCHADVYGMRLTFQQAMALLHFRPDRADMLFRTQLSEAAAAPFAMQVVLRCGLMGPWDAGAPLVAQLTDEVPETCAAALKVRHGSGSTINRSRHDVCDMPALQGVCIHSAAPAADGVHCKSIRTAGPAAGVPALCPLQPGNLALIL